MKTSELCTIGFTQKSAKKFFALLKDNGVTLVADIRLNNRSQLAGFTKAKDFPYFLSLHKMRYEHWTDFAPTKTLRDAFVKSCDFNVYAVKYTALVQVRGAVQKLPAGVFDRETVCLLCSEPTADKCHRRIAAELIQSAVKGLAIKHL